MVYLKVLVFGSELLKFDSLPLKLLPRLRKLLPKIFFKVFDPNEELDEEGRNLIILDTVANIRKVTVFTEKDIDLLETGKRFSLHDFDLGFTLKLLKKLKKIDSVKIIGVPPNYAKEKAVKEIISLFSN